MIGGTGLLYSPLPRYPPPEARADFLHSRGYALPPQFGFFQGDGITLLHPPLQLDRYKRRPFLHVLAATKGTKPPPKPASRGVIIGAILLPLTMAGSAVLVGRLLLARIQKEAMEEAEELGRRFNPSRLLPDGKTEEERRLERESRELGESANMQSTRSRPKREE